MSARNNPPKSYYQWLQHYEREAEAAPNAMSYLNQQRLSIYSGKLASAPSKVLLYGLGLFMGFAIANLASMIFVQVMPNTLFTRLFSLSFSEPIMALKTLASLLFYIIGPIGGAIYVHNDMKEWNDGEQLEKDRQMALEEVISRTKVHRKLLDAKQEEQAGQLSISVEGGDAGQLTLSTAEEGALSESQPDEE